MIVALLVLGVFVLSGVAVGMMIRGAQPDPYDDQLRRREQDRQVIEKLLHDLYAPYLERDDNKEEDEK
jgi:hypothetical protein